MCWDDYSKGFDLFINIPTSTMFPLDEFICTNSRLGHDTCFGLWISPKQDLNDFIFFPHCYFLLAALQIPSDDINDWVDI